MSLHEELTKRGAKLGDFVIFEKAVGIIISIHINYCIKFPTDSNGDYTWSHWTESDIDYGPFKALMRPDRDFYDPTFWVGYRVYGYFEQVEALTLPKKKIYIHIKTEGYCGIGTVIELEPDAKEVTIDGVVYRREE